MPGLLHLADMRHDDSSYDSSHPDPPNWQLRILRSTHALVLAVLTVAALGLAACKNEPPGAQPLPTTTTTTTKTATPTTTTRSAAPTTTKSTTTTTPTTPTTTTTNPPAGPSPAGYPRPGNTGVPSGTTFARTMGYYEAKTPGEVLDRVHFTSGVLVAAQGVTIKRSQIDDTVVVEGGSLTISDSTVGPARCGDDTWTPSGIVWNNYTATRVHVRGHADGFMASGSNITVRDSYVDICPYPGAHADGIQDHPRAENLVVDHTTFDMRNVGEPANGGLYINAGDQGQAPSRNVTLTDNLVMGDGGHGIWIYPADGTWIVRGNRLVDNGTAPHDWVSPAYTNGRCSYVDEWADNDVVTVDSTFAITGTVKDNLPCPK